MFNYKFDEIWAEIFPSCRLHSPKPALLSLCRKWCNPPCADSYLAGLALNFPSEPHAVVVLHCSPNNGFLIPAQLHNSQSVYVCVQCVFVSSNEAMSKLQLLCGDCGGWRITGSVVSLWHVMWRLFSCGGKHLFLLVEALNPAGFCSKLMFVKSLSRRQKDGCISSCLRRVCGCHPAGYHSADRWMCRALT